MSNDSKTEQESQQPNLEEYSDDALAEMSEQLGQEGRRLQRLAAGALFELEKRMQERGAKKLATDHYTGVVRPGGISYRIDDLDRLRERLRQHVDPGDVDRAFPEPKLPAQGVNQAVLNELLKLGGEIAEIINEERAGTRGRSNLELSRKPEEPEKGARP